MKIVKLGGWVSYHSEEINYIDSDKGGKWMHFFDATNVDYVSKVCEMSIKKDIVTNVKHTDVKETGSVTGVVCFYLNFDDLDTQKKVIGFLIENQLIRKTKTGKLFNISFKLNNQTRNNEYGKEFNTEIKLSKFIDLETGEWLAI